MIVFFFFFFSFYRVFNRFSLVLCVFKVPYYSLCFFAF